uniref:Uncharacterized protein n=1 Tax=Falco tinnunculus TaxID=100819 RepID=A0A8C4UYM2_FALTI
MPLLPLAWLGSGGSGCASPCITPPGAAGALSFCSKSCWCLSSSHEPGESQRRMNPWLHVSLSPSSHACRVPTCEHRGSTEMPLEDQLMPPCVPSSPAVPWGAEEATGRDGGCLGCKSLASWAASGELGELSPPLSVLVARACCLGGRRKSSGLGAGVSGCSLIQQ